MTRIIFIIVFININLFSQVLLNTFKPLIPSYFKDDEDRKDIVNSTLESLSEIEPALIYYYIEHLKLFSEHSSKGMKALSYLRYTEYNIKKELDAWARNELDIAFSKSINFPQWLRISAYLNHVRISPGDSVISVEPGYEIDINYRDYIVYMFYEKKFIEYEDRKNYSDLVNGLFEHLINEFTDVYYNLENYPSEKIDYYYDAAKRNPFLFRGSFLFSVKKTVPAYLTEFLVKLSSPAYLQKSSLKAGVQIDKFNGQTEYDFLYTDNVFSIRTNLYNLEKHSIFPGISGSLGLKKYKTYFSKLNFSFFTWFMNNETSDFRFEKEGNQYYILYGQYNGQMIGVRVDGDFDISPIKYKSQSYLLKLSTPLLYIFSNLSINCGLYARYDHHSYEGEITRRDSYKFSNLPGLGEELLTSYKRELKSSSDKFYYYPLLTFNYILFDFIDLHLSLYSPAEKAQYEIFLNYTL